MKKLTFLFLLLSSNFFAQYGDLHIDDRFDQVYDQRYGQIYNINSATNNIADQGAYSWSIAGLYSTNYAISKENQDNLGSSRTGSLDGLLVM